MYKNTLLLFLIILLTIIFSISYATETDLIGSKLRISISQNFTERYLFFSSLQQQRILLDINNRQFQYFSNVYKEFSSKIIFNSTQISLTLKPSQKFYYNLKYAVITAQSGNSEDADTNFFSFNNYGWSLNINGNYVLFPETLANHSILLGLGINVENYIFDLLKSENNVFYIDTNFKTIDIFANLLFSKRLKQRIDFVYGLEFINRKSFLFDNINFYEISGNRFCLNLIVASKIFLTSKEGIFILFKRSPYPKGDLSVVAGFVLEI